MINVGSAAQVTFLGPFGATFSHMAYDCLSRAYGSPSVAADHSNFVAASSNEEVTEKAVSHGAYAALAMETMAEGRVAEPLESFIRLIERYQDQEGVACPIHVIGSVRMRISFCLMVNPRSGMKAPERIVGHAKAFGACREKVRAGGFQQLSVPSNGEAARLVAQDPAFIDAAALAPRLAASKYGLKITEESFEDREAFTTFFLLGPRVHPVVTGASNRALVIFRLSHRPGSLVRALASLAAFEFNLVQIHSAYSGNGAYDFAIELDVPGERVASFGKAIRSFSGCVERHICFGPFEVRSDL